MGVRQFTSGSAGGYSRRKTPNSTGVSRYREEMGPGSIAEMYRWLDNEVKAGRMTPGDKQRRVVQGR